MTCNFCKSTNIKTLVTDTNSTYTYCTNCKDSYEIASKHIAIDAILKRLLNNLKALTEKSLKIEIKQENNSICLIINNKKIFETHFTYNFIKGDIYHLENIIFELVEDYYEFDTSKVDILVCV